MQSGPADGFSVGDALLAQPVAVVVSVPAQLDVSHASILLGGRTCIWGRTPAGLRT
jgi:hypothetical protein